jgi:glutamine synthetase
MRLPKSVLLNTVNGEQPNNTPYVGATDPDMVCVPDPATIRVVPWATERVACVIHDCQNFDGTRSAWRRARCCARCCGCTRTRLAAGGGAGDGVLPGRAQQNPHEPLSPPTGRSGKTGAGPAVVFDRRGQRLRSVFPRAVDLLQAARAGRRDADPRGRRGPDGNQFYAWRCAGTGRPRVPVQARVRETALRHGIFATFMAKPMETEPGSAMHVHQSVVDTTTGRNIFSATTASESDAVPSIHRRAGKVRAGGHLLFAPHVNSYRRLSRFQSAPTNVHWGYDNRTCGIRIAEFHAGQPPGRKPRAGRGRESRISRWRPRWPAATSA